MRTPWTTMDRRTDASERRMVSDYRCWFSHVERSIILLVRPSKFLCFTPLQSDRTSLLRHRPPATLHLATMAASLDIIKDKDRPRALRTTIR